MAWRCRKIPWVCESGSRDPRRSNRNLCLNLHPRSCPKASPPLGLASRSGAVEGRFVDRKQAIDQKGIIFEVAVQAGLPSFNCGEVGRRGADLTARNAAFRVAISPIVFTLERTWPPRQNCAASARSRPSGPSRRVPALPASPWLRRADLGIFRNNSRKLLLRRGCLGG